VDDDASSARDTLANSATERAPASLGVGQTVGARYELLAELGRGAHGAVFKAKDHHADEIIALKMLLDVEAGYLALLRRELSAARRVTHRGVVRMYDLVEIDGGFALSMEYVEGKSLASLIEEQPLAPARVKKIAVGLAEALAAAHAAGITHRDLKPANVLVRTDDTPVITDFGISRMPEGGGGAERPESAHVRFTTEGALIGTPLYMAPEQLRGETDIDPSVDVYAWGLVVHEMLTGRVPHEAASVAKILELREKERPPPLAAPGLSARLAAAVDASLSPDRRERPRSGQALLDLLVPPTQPVPSGLHSRPPSRRDLRAGLVAVAVGALALGGVGVWWASTRSQGGTAVTSASAAPSAAAPGGAASDLFRVENPRRVTFDPGCEEYPSFFPDEETVLFDKSIGDRSHLFTKNLRTQEERQLTTSPKWDYAAALSPDGTYVAFLRLDDTLTTQLLHLPTGTLENLGPGQTRPSFQEDGRSVWLGAGPTVQRVDVRSRAVLETIHAPPGTEALRLVSLSGDRRAALLRTGERFADRLMLFEKGEWRVLHTGVFRDMLSPLPDGEGVTAVFDESAIEQRLVVWRDQIVTAPTRIMSDGALSASRRRAIWTTCGGKRELLPLDLAAKSTAGAEPAIEATAAATFPDGRIVFISSRDGTWNKLWVTDSAKRPLREVRGAHGVPEEVTVKGAEVAVATSTGIWRGSVWEDGKLEQWTSLRQDAQPSIAHDGALVFTRAETGGAFQVMRQTSARAAPERLFSLASPYAVAHPLRDEVLYFDRGRLFANAHGDVRAITKEPIAMDTGPLSISSDGKALAVVVGRTEAMVLDTGSGATRQTVRAPPSGSFRRFHFSPSGEVHAILETWIGDLWLGDVVAP
jgi:serine/threonine protein kinase/dipeptidyl aminopeptidase/acylaminoacyl peptidase